jgi:hypothetical protein
MAVLSVLLEGRWSAPAKGVLRTITMTLPYLAVLFIPVALGVSHIYPWASEGASSYPTGYVNDPVVMHKRPYLNVPFFIIRAALYFTFWCAITFGFRTLTVRHKLSGVTMVLLFVTATFAAIDWVQSLDPYFHSTIFGLIFFTASIVLGISFTIVASAARARAPDKAFLDMGNLFLAAFMLFGYVSVSQLIIIWSGNLPEENRWYLARSRDGLGTFAGLIAIFYLGLPFFLLTIRALKRNPKWLGALGLFSLAAGAAHMLWLVAPSFTRAGILNWRDAVAFCAVGIVWLAAFSFHAPRAEVQ